MRVFKARNASEMMYDVYPTILRDGVEEDSRNGPVLRFPTPVTLVYEKPAERVVLDPVRDANPFFHLMEAMQMLSGENSVDWLSSFNSNIANYSDNGRTFNAFYGERAREIWGDQLTEAGKLLRRDPLTRQAVVNLWDPADLTKETKDKACNMMMVFAIRGGKVDMTVYNRSNDAVWGSVSGANVVHFAFFQEFVAGVAGYEMGEYYQVSNNLHIYPGVGSVDEVVGQYANGGPILEAYPGWSSIFEASTVGRFEESLDAFIISTAVAPHVPYKGERLQNRFIRETVVPVYNAWVTRKYVQEGLPPGVDYWLNKIDAADWRVACTNWVKRRDA